jgi:hypothetical protein
MATEQRAGGSMTTLTISDLIAIAKGSRTRLRRFRRAQFELHRLRAENRAMSDLLCVLIGDQAFRAYRHGLQQSMK